MCRIIILRVDCQSYLSLLEIKMEILGSVPVVSHNYLVFSKLQTFPTACRNLDALSRSQEVWKKRRRKKAHRNRSQLLFVS